MREEEITRIEYKDILTVMSEVYRGLDKKETLSTSVRRCNEVMKEMVQEARTGSSSTLSFAHIASPRIGYVPRHVVETTMVSLHVGIKLKLADSDLEDLGLASLLHCVGRPIDLNDCLSQHNDNPGPVDRYVSTVIEGLAGMDGMRDRVRDIVKRHRETIGPDYDPCTALPEKFGVPGRILMLADCYCTLLHHPARAKGYYPYSALKWLLEHESKPFEAEVLKALVDCIGVYPVGSWVELSTGKFAEVVAPNSGHPMRPCVRLAPESARNRSSQRRIIDLFKNPVIHIKRVVPESDIRRK
jgi:hypothetical protein